MANFLNKFQIRSARKNSLTKFDLSCDHITTSDFMVLGVPYLRELVPGQKINCHCETFSRLAPMPAPTFGRAKIYNRAFFVPFRTIFNGWNDFITDTPHSDSTGTSLLQSVPTISNDDFIALFTDSDFSQTTTGDADFTVYTPGTPGTTVDYVYTKLGKWFMKILNQLGYFISFVDGDKVTYSALPLLAYTKIYMDWYFPSQYVGDTSYVALAELLARDGAFTVNASDLEEIAKFTQVVCYDSDYFVSAFDNPAGPAIGTASDVFINDLSSFDVYGTTSAHGLTPRLTNTDNPVSLTNRSSSSQMTPHITPYADGSDGRGAVPLSQYLLDSLHALSDYMHRHQLAGARALDRYLARFGVTLPAEKLNRSVYLGSQSIPLQFGDVMSQSDTTGANLGSYAGKGIAYGDDGNFSCETDEFGIFLVLSSIVPDVGYYQGLDKAVVRTDRLSFFTPEFDSLGCEPIRADELVVPFDGASSLADAGDIIFGFSPRYSSYKVSRDKVTGDYNVPTQQLSNGSYHLDRSVDYGQFASAANIKHSLGFTRGLDRDQYLRIFYASDPVYTSDKFNLIYRFHVESYAPMKPLYDMFDYSNEDGKDMILDVNGVKMN